MCLCLDTELPQLVAPSTLYFPVSNSFFSQSTLNVPVPLSDLLHPSPGPVSPIFLFPWAASDGLVVFGILLGSTSQRSLISLLTCQPLFRSQPISLPHKSSSLPHKPNPSYQLCFLCPISFLSWNLLSHASTFLYTHICVSMHLVYMHLEDPYWS